MYFFSIIIPIFNVEKYLSECIDSVLKQEEKCEIILIDDGSKDNSGEIADLYAENHSNVIVVHQENKGLSAARNEGIKNANGKFIIFLDSDDLLVQGSLKKIRDLIEEHPGAEIYFGNIIKRNSCKFDTRIKKDNLIPNHFYAGKEAIYEELQFKGKFMAMAPSGIYERVYLKLNKFCFRVGVLHEDEEWMPRVELLAKRIMYFNVDFYIYRIREGSITTQLGKERNAKDLRTICEELREIYSDINEKDIKKHLECYLAKLYIHATSILIRIKDDCNIDKSYVSRKWITKKDLIRFTIFNISPYFYAHFIDKKFIT